MLDNSSVAVFIDAENIPAKYAKEIFDYASNYGNVIIKRIYADWSKENIQNWREKIFDYGIIAMQQFSTSSGKNSSDMYLTTEALSIFYEKQIDVFVIVSGDSDYTSLAQKLRENKKLVIGIGTNKSLKSYVNSFNEFFYLDNEKVKNSDKDRLKAIPKEQLKELEQIIDNLIDEKTRAEYAVINTYMQKKYSDFHAKNYGFSSFRQLIENFILKHKEYQEKVSDDRCTYYLVKNSTLLRPNKGDID